MALTKIGSIGINTGIAFAGVTTIATLNASTLRSGHSSSLIQTAAYFTKIGDT